MISKSWRRSTGQSVDHDSLWAVLLMHAEDLARPSVEVKGLLDVDDGRGAGRAERRSDDSRVSVLEVLQEERNLLAEDRADDVDLSAMHPLYQSVHNVSQAEAVEAAHPRSVFGKRFL
jgi:hypothetical protein